LVSVVMHFYAYSLFCISSAFVISHKEGHSADAVSEDHKKVRKEKTREDLKKSTHETVQGVAQEDQVSTNGAGSPPTSFIAMAVMLLIHGFFLDVIVIGWLPFISASAADGSRQELFPWCLGGYEGFGAEKVPNLAPTHRRFIAENSAYSLLRGGAGICVLYDPSTAMPALMLAVASHWIEAITIAWELISYNAPKDSSKPLTLMGVFSSWVLYTVMTNTDDYLKVEPNYLLAMQVMVGLTWLSWLSGLGSIGMRTEPTE